MLFFYSFCVVSFVITTFDKFHFQSQIGLSQTNIVVPIGLKFKFFTVFIERGSRINFLLAGRQNIVKYWDFPSNTFRDCHKTLVPKSISHDCWKMVVKYLFATNWFVSQMLLERLCLHSFSCYHYLLVFSEFVFRLSLQLSWTFFCHQQYLQFLANQFSTKQYPRILQLG